MSTPAPEGPRFAIQTSGAIAKELVNLQQQATMQGKGQDLMKAFRHVLDRLRSDPFNLGEPLYRLPVLRMQVRTVVKLPLVCILL